MFTLGLLAPVETVTDDQGNSVGLIIQDWMQRDRNGGELYDPLDTCDFHIKTND